MKKTIIIFFIFLTSFLNSQDSLNDTITNDKINKITLKISELIKSVENQNNKLTELIKSNEKSFTREIEEIDENQKSFLINYSKSYDSINSLIFSQINQLILKDENLNNQLNEIKKNAEILNNDIKNANNDVSEIKKSSSINSNNIENVNRVISEKQQYGIIIFGLALILILIVYIVLSKKWSKDTKNLAEKQKEIFERQINDSLQITELLNKQSEEEFSQKNLTSNDHSFAIKVGGLVTRLNTTLNIMDKDVKGHKKLVINCERLEKSLQDNGYELVPLLNKPYNDGMKLVASFREDDSISKGERIITQIIKPQINYKGKLIQSAEVIVSVGE
tara:strand:- start:10425 stop:11426 length:1002 start_codon:yes stop_codon:yes gene_type:complete